jgi:phage nucleotide-binding protein
MTVTQEVRRLGGIQVLPVQERAALLNILIYGDSGVGKTTLAGSADAVPSMRPVLVVDIEGGTESLRHSYPEVEHVRVQNWHEMQAVYDDLHAGRHDFQTVVLDSLTEIQKFDMYNIMADLARQRPDLDPDIPSMREWGKNLEHMRRFVRGFRDLPINTVFTALVKQDQDKRSGLTKYRPSLSGKLADEVAAFLDIVGYYYVKQVSKDQGFQRLLLTGATDSHVAKDRTGRLPTVMEEPTMADIFPLIQQNTTEE